MARCVIGIGGPRSADFPFRRAHVGRAFVEHVAEAHSFTRWRPASGALADICEHGSGIVLCRLWPDAAGDSASGGAAARQCLRYLGVRSAGHVIVAHAEPKKLCGQFGVVEGAWRAPIWASGVVEALTPPSVSRASEASRSQPSSSSAAAVPQQPLVAQQPQAPLRLQLGIGSPGRGTL
ncbi:unnamed protein product, partial [Polarella glacialis]